MGKIDNDFAICLCPVSVKLCHFALPSNMTSHALCCYLEYFHIIRVFGVCTF